MRGRSFESRRASLVVLVQVVVLDLAEVPRIGIKKRLEVAFRPMVGETDLLDTSSFLLLRNPLLNADLDQVLP